MTRSSSVNSLTLPRAEDFRPALLDDVLGRMTLPSDFDILRLRVDQEAVCEHLAVGRATARYQATSSELWNQPRC